MSDWEELKLLARRGRWYHLVNPLAARRLCMQVYNENNFSGGARMTPRDYAVDRLIKVYGQHMSLWPDDIDVQLLPVTQHNYGDLRSVAEWVEEMRQHGWQVEMSVPRLSEGRAYRFRRCKERHEQPMIERRLLPERTNGNAQSDY